MMVAVHAWRSAKSIRAFADRYPDRPLVVLLAGTDIYRFQHSHPEETLSAMECATLLVCLHDLVHKAIPVKFGPRLRIIHQSAPPLTEPRNPSVYFFDVCVVGHLRDEKDSLRAAYAARSAPENSRLRVTHLGKAHTEEWEKAAVAEMARNPRFKWMGEVDDSLVRRQLARSNAMVISSIMEGGANVVSEAIMASLPVIASYIDGNVGLLGADYTGYYPAKDTDALAALLQHAEHRPGFLKQLTEQCKQRQPLFTANQEKENWRRLLAEISPQPVRP